MIKLIIITYSFSDNINVFSDDFKPGFKNNKMKPCSNLYVLLVIVMHNYFNTKYHIF